MKIKKINVGLSGVIPVSAYANLRPAFDMEIELNEGEDYKKAFDLARTYVRNMFEEESNRAKTDLIAKEYENIRFYEKDGKKFPSVTSILGWDIDWSVSEDELIQYASRGTIVHKLIEIYLTSGQWANPLDLTEVSKEVGILATGSKNLSWQDCSYKPALESLSKDLEIIEIEKTVYNNEHLYAGKFDLLGKYKGKLSIIDFKTGSTSDFRQLSAYASCIKGVEQLVIVPVGVSDTKQGYSRPKVCDNIEKEFKEFIRARIKFRQRFGV